MFEQKMVTKVLFPYVFIGMVCLLFSACASKSLPMVGERGREYQIATVEVRLAQDLKLDPFPQLDGESKESLVQRATKRLKEVVYGEVKGTLRGDKPARLEVTIDTLNISSGIGQILAQSNSFLGGRVKLLDDKTDEIIAENTIIAKQGTNIQGNVGVLIALAVNTASIAKSDRVDAIASVFADHTKEWLQRQPKDR